MIRLSVLTITFIAIITAAAMSSSSTGAQSVNVTGTWKMTVETQAGSGTPIFTLKQNGETLTGTYKGQFGEMALKGTVKGKDIKFVFNLDIQGRALDVEYSGTVEDNTMKGTVKYGDIGDGTFTGKKQ